MQAVVVMKGQIFIKTHFTQPYEVARVSEVVSTQLFPALRLHVKRRPGTYSTLLETQLLSVPWWKFSSLTVCPWF